MLRRKRNPKGCKKAQKDCKKSLKCLAIEPQMPGNRASNALQKSLNCLTKEPYLPSN